MWIRSWSNLGFLIKNVNNSLHGIYLKTLMIKGGGVRILYLNYLKIQRSLKVKKPKKGVPQNVFFSFNSRGDHVSNAISDF
jgi:hypothetical protein